VNNVVDDLLRAADQGLVRDARGLRLTTDGVRELHWSLTGYVREALGRARLSDVRPRDMTDLLGDLERAGLPPRRLRPVAESVRTLFDYAIERGFIERNPAGRLAVPDGPGPPRRARSRAALKRSDRAIALGLELATVALMLFAVVLLGHALIA
jgi:hypothetical protein